MSESPRCPKCDAPLPADAPAGLCPKCLVQAGFESRPEPPPHLEPTLRSPATTGFEPPSVEELAGKFPQLEILELLGKGGMGAVYKARQPGLDRLVAVKILPPEISRDRGFVERFQREARALAQLSHPHIVAVYDFGERSGLCYFVMEFVDGANLRQTIQSGGLSPDAALAIVPQICEALQFAHDEGIVHRDIKPENILIDKRGRVKIADFGLAKLLAQDAGDHALTGSHQVMGTLRYMAPEQMQGAREVDHRADIYSLGVVFYELLTGELPMGKFAPPSKRVLVDVRLDEIVLRALEQEPEHRYQHASEVKTDVEMISRASQSPNRAAQKPAHRDGRIALSEPVSLPFEIAESVHWGLFGEVHGKLRLGKNELVVEFEVRSLFPAFRSGLKEVSIPFDDIESVNWDGWDLTIHTKTMKALAEIPKSSQGQVAFDLSMTDLDVPGGISEPVEHFLACLPSRLVGKSASVTSPLPAKGAATEPRLVQSPADCLLLAAGMAFVTACGVAVWLLAAPTSPLIPSLVRGNLTIASVILATYSLLIGVAGLMLRQLRAPFFVLLLDVIAGLFLPAVIAVNVAMEFRHMPDWPVAIPLWLGVPAALWVVVTLFRDDVRRAFEAAADQRRLRGLGNSQQQDSHIAQEPRLSRLALMGAIWAGVGVMTLILAPLFVFPSQRASHGPTVSSSIDTEPAAASTEIASGKPTETHGVNFLFGFVMLIVAVALSASSVIGTTICGAVAIGHIKRSGGKLYGLGLAQADALFYPLLLLAGAAGFVALIILTTAIRWGIDPRVLDKNEVLHLLNVVLAAPLWIFPARALWRAVVGPRDAFTLGKLPLVGHESLMGQAALVLALAAIAAHAWPWHWIISPSPSPRSMTISNFDVIDALQSFWLLVLSIGAALFATAATLARPAKMILRGGSVIAALAALVIQVQFFRSLGEFEPGRVEKVVRLTRTYEHMSVYVTMALTSLAILFFVWRFFEESTARPGLLARTESDDA